VRLTTVSVRYEAADILRAMSLMSTRSRTDYLSRLIEWYAMAATTSAAPVDLFAREVEEAVLNFRRLGPDMSMLHQQAARIRAIRESKLQDRTITLGRKPVSPFTPPPPAPVAPPADWPTGSRPTPERLAELDRIREQRVRDLEEQHARALRMKQKRDHIAKTDAIRRELDTQASKAGKPLLPSEAIDMFD
jgi:hypothetical protein